MTIDRYTKAVLTVIAACLVWLCVMTTARPLSAQASDLQQTVQPVVVVGTGTLDRHGKIEIHFKDRSDKTDPTLPVAAASPLPVALPYTPSSPMPARLTYSEHDPLAIEITSVRKSGEWEPLRTAVEDAPTRPRPGGGRH